MSQAPECCPSSRANFCATPHNLSCRRLRRNRTLAWSHRCYWRQVLGTCLELALVRLGLKLDFRSLRPLVWCFKGRWHWWVLGPRNSASANRWVCLACIMGWDGGESARSSVRKTNRKTSGATSSPPLVFFPYWLWALKYYGPSNWPWV